MTQQTARAACTIFVALLMSTAALAQGRDPDISAIRGDLYRLRSGDQQTVFLATPDGVVLVDPLSLETAQWLADELARRFVPGAVRMVLHTSHRFDRSEGAQWFDANTPRIGHRAYNAELSRARQSPPRPLPADRQQAERLLRSKDRDGDGRLTGNELYRRVFPVDSDFEGKRVVSIASRTVEIVHAPLPDEPDNAIVIFPRERVAFASAAPPIGTTPLTFGVLRPREMRQWLTAATSTRFDVLLLADGGEIPWDELVKASTYVDDLITRVAAEYESGTGAAEFGDTKMPAAVTADPMFREWRANVRDVYGEVSVFRIDAAVGAFANYVLRDAAFCESFTTCASGGVVPAASGSLSATYRRFTVVSEVIASREAFSSRTSRFYDEDFALRETRVGVMAGLDLPAGAVSYRIVAGLSHAVAYREGVYRIKEGLAAFAGRRPLESREVRRGLTGGIDISMGRKVGVVIPLRFNYATDAATSSWPSRFDAQAGLALKLRLLRNID